VGDQSSGARLASLPPDGTQQQHRMPIGADAAVVDLVQPLVDAEQRRENGLDERIMARAWQGQRVKGAAR
jgi:hypothetical protein